MRGRGQERRGRRRGRRAALLAALPLLLLLPAAAPVSFEQAVNQAWRRSPDLASLDARRRTALARMDAARSLFPGAPTLTGTYFDDHFIGSNEGYTTYQAELSTPVWLPGEGTANETVAADDARGLAAERGGLRLAVAAQVLSATAEARFSQRQLLLARARRDAAARLAAAMTRAVHTGELARIDADAARAERDSAELACNAAEARLLNAIATLRSLTGLSDIPRLPDASLAQLAAVSSRPGGPASDVSGAAEDDPRLEAARRRLQSARETLHLVRITPIDDPQVGVYGLRDRQYQSPWDTRVGVELQIPLPSTARNEPRLAGAEGEVTRAEAELVRLQRSITLARSEAETGLAAARLSLRDARDAAAALDHRAAVMDKGWRVGEVPLIELVRARQSAFDADLQRERAAIGLQAAVLQVSLAVGVVP